MSHAIHDFGAKLRQPSLLPAVKAYLAWRRRLARARAAGEPEPEPPRQAPVSINLDLTTACNYRCDHCIDWEILNSKQRHADATLRRSLETLAGRGLRSVILIGGGEPTLYPGFVDFVGFLKDLSLDVAVVSNGSRGERILDVAHRLGERDWVRLSLDAGSNELFRAMHRPARADLDLDAICSWVPRWKQRSPTLRVGFSYIIVWPGAARSTVPLHPNVHEIVLATERARDAGFDSIALKPLLGRAQDGAEVMDAEAVQAQDEQVARIRAEVDRARALTTPEFRVYVSTNLRVLEEGSWRELTRQPRVCHMQALRQVLTPTGLYNCPAHRGVERARIDDADAWAGDEAARRSGARLAALMDRFDASRECARVTCLYNAVNWWLEKEVEDPNPELVLEPAGERLDSFL